MKRPVKLSVIRSERQRDAAKEIRRELYGSMKDVVDDAGDGIAGYALVVWDKQGANWSTLRGGSPIQTRLAPTFVQDALSQHVAVNMTLDKFKR